MIQFDEFDDHIFQMGWFNHQPVEPIELLMVEPSTNPPPNWELFEADLLGGAVGTSKLHLSFGIPIRVGNAE